MLINCPRCNFSQPKDQYCASCGVNIDLFIPVRISLRNRLFSNNLFQAFIVILLALCIALYSFKKHESKNLNLSKQIQRKKQTFSTLSSPTVTVELKTTDQENKITGTTIETEKIIFLKYSYHEIPQDTLNQWLDLNINYTNYSELGSVRVGEIDTLIENKSNMLLTENKQIKLSGKEIFKHGYQQVLKNQNDKAFFLGLQTEITITQIAQDFISGTARILRKNSNGNELINVPFNIKNQHTFFIFWDQILLGFDENQKLVKIPPFQILKSQNYLNQKTKLILTLESVLEGQ